jgi:hypothetical protein
MLCATSRSRARRTSPGHVLEVLRPAPLAFKLKSCLSPPYRHLRSSLNLPGPRIAARGPNLLSVAHRNPARLALEFPLLSPPTEALSCGLLRPISARPAVNWRQDTARMKVTAALAHDIQQALAFSNPIGFLLRAASAPYPAPLSIESIPVDLIVSSE